MKTIALTKGQVAIIDDEDYEWACQWKWQAYERKQKHLPTQWYATRKQYQRGVPDGGPTLYMHRALLQRMGFYSSEVDHVDSNGLNNRRSNLRPCSASQNQANRRKESGTSSRFKGVYWYKKTRKWMAKIVVKKKSIYLGYFECETDAAHAYNRAAWKFFGDFFHPNVVPCR